MIVAQGTLWPVHPKPFDGEILSSWMSRTAWAHGFSLQQFRRQCLPKACGQGADIDEIDDDGFFAVLASGAGVSVEDARVTSLVSEEGRVFTRLTFNNLEWIAPLSLLRGRARQQAIPFCPSCLTSDEIPYYRKRWRYAFHAVCPKHGLLICVCPRCGHPYGYIGHDGEAGTHVASGEIGVCRACSQRFGQAQVPGLDDAVLASVSDIQESILSSLDAGWVEVEGIGRIHVCLYLRGLHDLALLFQNPHFGADAVVWMGRNARGTVPIWDPHDWLGSLESRSPVVRAWLVLFATWLMQEWPIRLVAFMRGLGLSPSQTLGMTKDRPFWMVHPNIEELTQTAVGRRDEEIQSARRVLAARMNWPPSDADLRYFMETGRVPDIKPPRRPLPPEVRQRFELGEKKAEHHRHERNLRREQPRTLYPPLPPSTTAQLLAEEPHDELYRAVPALDRLFWRRRTAPSDG